MIVFIALLIGALTWYAWHGPNAFMKKLTAKGRFFVTLAGVVLMAGLFVFGDPQNPEVMAPLMGVIFALAVLFGYLDFKRTVHSE